MRPEGSPWGRLAAGLVIAFAVLPFSATANTPAETAAPERWISAFLDVTVNGAPAGEALLVRLDHGDAWVSRDELGRAGLVGLAGKEAEVEGARWVSLRSLAPALSFEVDEAALTLRISASAQLLGRRTVDLRSVQRPASLEVRADPALFVNYALSGSDTGDGAAFVEAGASAAGARLTSGVSRGMDGQVSRGLTAAAYELRSSLVEIAAGDVLARGDLLGGSLVLGGVSVKRDFGLDPYFVRAPLPQATAFALTPSTLELYVNGGLVRRESVGPGVLDLAHIPVVTGRGETRAVLRDAFGRTQEFSSEYYAGAGLLAPGLSDFAYDVGFTREALSGAGLDYRRAAFLGRHRLGLTPSLTAGLRLDAGLDRVSGGPMLVTALPIGELEIAAAASGHDRSAGAAGSLAWSWTSRRVSSRVLLRSMSPRYANASLGARDDRALGDSRLRVAFPATRRIDLSADASITRWRDRGREGRVGGGITFGLGSGASLHLSGGWSGGDRASGFESQALLTWSTGSRSTLQLSVDNRRSEAQARLSAHRSLPRGEGVGYRVEAMAGGPDARGSGELQWQSRVARVEARVERSGPLESATATASGAVVWMGGDLFFTRPVQDGFALVEVADVPGVQITLENQEVGRTGKDGRLLVPGLMPYYGNRLAFRPADVPLEYDFGALERVVAPPRRGGAHVRFAVEKTRTLTGALAVDLGSRVVTPAYGEIRVATPAGELSSPITGDGRFFLEKLDAGTHAAVVEHASGICRLALAVPERVGLLDVGLLRCDQRPAVSGVGGDAAPAASSAPIGPPSASTVTTSTAGALASAAAR